MAALPWKLPRYCSAASSESFLAMSTQHPVAVPAVQSVESAKVAGLVAAWASLGAVIAGVAAFLQNYAEALEADEQA